MTPHLLSLVPTVQRHMAYFDVADASSSLPMLSLRRGPGGGPTPSRSPPSLSLRGPPTISLSLPSPVSKEDALANDPPYNKDGLVSNTEDVLVSFASTKLALLRLLCLPVRKAVHGLHA